MAIEMLAIKIRSNNIRGLEIQGLKTKLSMYADDSGFMLSPQARSLQCLIEDLDNFSELSGLKSNYDVYNIMYWILKKYNFYITLQLTYKMG